MDLEHITPLILTWNEETNIDLALRRLNWARRIVVIDSGSDDETVKIVQRFPQVELFTRSFDTHAKQWNFGMKQVATPWILSLDADYRVMPDLLREIAALPENSLTVAYSIALRQCVGGRPLGRSLMPPRLALFRKDRAVYIQDGHTQLLVPRGPVKSLRAGLWHDDRKPLRRWLKAQIPYADLEAQKFGSTEWRNLNWPDRIRRFIIVAPFLVPLVVFFGQGAILEGRRGLYYCLQRMVAELILSLALLERTIKKSPGKDLQQVIGNSRNPQKNYQDDGETKKGDRPHAGMFRQLNKAQKK